MSRFALLFAASLVALPAHAGPHDDAHEKLAAAFVAALPPSGPSAREPRAHDLERSADIAKRHPAKATQVRAIFDARVTCSSERQAESVQQLMLDTARSLSDADLRSLIGFYTGPDHARLETIADGTPEWDALIARYPLIRFTDAMNAEMSAHMMDQVFAAEQACDEQVAAALAKEGITE
jgi:hypothetical protein